jgi:putative glutathione S-transferase
MTTTNVSALEASTSPEGAFTRQKYIIQGRITADGSSGYKAEPGRYHLYVSLACPWAHRAIIVRRLLGLEDVISMSVVDPVRDERGWAFTENFPDPVNGFHFLSQAYLATDPEYSLRYTVPCIWDRQTSRLVTNNFPDITIDFETQFRAFQRPDAPDLYPEALRSEIDDLSGALYEDVNDGVYRCGFAASQEAYEYAFDRLFARLDELEDRLADRRYLMGDQITEADIRLFPTLVRFDTVYHYHFKCNQRRLVDYPNLWGYTRDLFATSGFGDTTNFEHIKRHYYLTHPQINPSGIIPGGPAIDWKEQQRRNRV